MSKKVRLARQTWRSATLMTETICYAEFANCLEHWPARLGERQRKYICAAAIAAYHPESGWPVIEMLVCADAPQFNGPPPSLALC